MWWWHWELEPQLPVSHCLPGPPPGCWLFYPSAPWALPGLIFPAPVSRLATSSLGGERPVFYCCPKPLVEAQVQEGGSEWSACALQHPVSWVGSILAFSMLDRWLGRKWVSSSGTEVHLCLAVAIPWGLPICHGLGKGPMRQETDFPHPQPGHTTWVQPLAVGRIQ